MPGIISSGPTFSDAVDIGELDTIYSRVSGDTPATPGGNFHTILAGPAFILFGTFETANGANLEDRFRISDGSKNFHPLWGSETSMTTPAAFSERWDQSLFTSGQREGIIKNVNIPSGFVLEGWGNFNGSNNIVRYEIYYL